MSQVEERSNTQEIISSEDNLPATQEEATQEEANQASEFVAKATQKVQLDIEDAPFLEDNKPEEKKENAPAKKKEEAKTEEGEKTEEEPKKSKKKLFIIAGAGVLLVAILVAVFLLFFSEPSAPPPVLQNFITIPNPPVEEIPVSLELKLDPFWIDLKNDGHGAKFLVATFVLVLPDESVQQELVVNIKVIRDAIYYYLISVDPAFLLATENVEAIKTGIMDIVNPYIINGKLDALYFDSYLMK